MSEKLAVLAVERWLLANIKPHPKNPRKHPTKGSAAWLVLQQSLEHDYFDPLVVNRCNSMLVSGHLRHRVLTAAGFTHADVSVVDYDEATHVARLIAANSLIGEFDDAALTELAKMIDVAGLGSSLAGWDEKELASMLSVPEIQDDTDQAVELVSKADQLQAEWQVAPGDLFAVGDHRLLCGDCRKVESWQILLGCGMADMVWTDPPYNVNYDDLQQMRINVKAKQGKVSHDVPQEIINDDLSADDYRQLLHSSLARAFEFTKSGGAIYVAHADSHGLITREAFANVGWKLAQNLIWIKNSFTLGRQDYQWQHEPILYGWKPGAAHYWQGGFSQSSILDDEEKNLGKLDKPGLIQIIQRLRNERNTDIVRESRNNMDFITAIFGAIREFFAFNGQLPK
jgi:hypothetical protein